ncbi:unnamed protein product [Colias eurytheme]|nr:unnamed protein product [Colias eurytheme]
MNNAYSFELLRAASSGSERRASLKDPHLANERRRETRLVSSNFCVVTGISYLYVRASYPLAQQQAVLATVQARHDSGTCAHNLPTVQLNDTLYTAFGASKSGYRWKRYWADLKHKPIPTPSTSSAIYEDIATECVEITIESSPPPPASERLIDIGQTTTPISPSTRGNTVSDRVQAPASADPNRTRGPRSNADSPVSRRLPRSSVRSRNISDPRTRQRVDPSWIVDMENRRIDAEQKLVDAMMIIAEARRDELDISRRQLALTETLAQALRELTNVLKIV